MNEDGYRRLSAPFRAEPLARALILTNKALTALGYIAYPALLVTLALAGRFDLLARCILVPGVAFAAVTLLRRAIDARRPYEALDIDPVIKKETSGRSFPSRHAFSLFMIAVSWMVAQPAVGCALIACATALAFIRVIGGVHYPRDVAAGALLAVLAGLVGYVLIPLQ